MLSFLRFFLTLYHRMVSIQAAFFLVMLSTFVNILRLYFVSAALAVHLSANTERVIITIWQYFVLCCMFVGIFEIVAPGLFSRLVLYVSYVF